MNTEKIEKLKKSLSNSKIPSDLKPKIESEIKRLEDLDAKQSAPKEEVKEEVKPVAKTRKPRAKTTSTRKPSETNKPKRTPMSLAKEIRKEGESWSEARARASKIMKEKTHTVTKDVESELDKLSKLVRSKKELRGQVGHTNLLRDAKRKAKPMGRRVSEDGNVYYENRANRTDKGTFGKYHLANGGEISSKQLDLGYQYSFNKDEDNVGSLYKEAGVYSVIGFENGKHFSESFEKFADAKNFYLDKKGKVKFELGGNLVTDLAGHTGGSLGGDPTMLDGMSGTSYTGLVGETGAMSSGEMFMAGGTLPEGASQSYMITESLGNPAQHFSEGGGIHNKNGILKEEKMKKQRLKDGDQVVVIGRRWFDRVNGNTYHTAEVEVNGEFVGKSPMTYGYDEQYLETAKEILLEHFDFPNGMTERSPLWQLREYGITLTKIVTDGLKRELAKGGGFAEHNGRKYDIGRNWTKDHNEFDKGADHEVEYRRKKSLFADGGEFMTDPTFGNFQNQVFADGGGVGEKKYNMQFNVGKAKYVINTYDGVKKHKDGSEFYDTHIFKTKPMFDEFERKLIKEGYKYSYADGGFMDGVYAKGGKVSPFKNMMETNTITEKEINLIKLRLNNDKVDEDTQEAIDYIWEEMPKLTPDQNKKGIDYLRNLWKSPTGKERANNPFGYREQDALETFEYFELRGFYDAGNRYRKFYVPLYTCVGADSSFEYAFYNGEVNILG